MPQHLPARPGGTDPRAIWEASVEDRLREMRIIDVSGMVVHRTRRGTAIIAKPGRGGGGISISAYRFKRIGDEDDMDYIVCTKWDDTSDPPKEIEIALPFKLRASVETEEIDGITYEYSDWNSLNQTRISTNADDDTDVETQVITPRYLEGDLIFAFPGFTGAMGLNQDPEQVTIDNLVPVVFQDLNVDARAYCRVFDETT